jgi:hypothetical protein
VKQDYRQAEAQKLWKIGQALVTAPRWRIKNAQAIPKIMNWGSQLSFVNRVCAYPVQLNLIKTSSHTIEISVA